METITTEVVNTGEKRDALGRRMAGAEQRAALIAAYEASGLTQREFTRREGLSYWSFAKWLSRTRTRQQPRAKATFAEVAAIAGRGSSPVEVALPDGVVVRGSDLEQVVGLVERLRRC